MSSYPEPPRLYFYTAAARLQISASHCVNNTMQNWKDLGFHGRQILLIMLAYTVRCNLNTHIMSWRGLTICQQTASTGILLLAQRHYFFILFGSISQLPQRLWSVQSRGAAFLSAVPVTAENHILSLRELSASGFEPGTFLGMPVCLHHHKTTKVLITLCGAKEISLHFHLSYWPPTVVACVTQWNVQLTCWCGMLVFPQWMT